jgi:hypothetical protein
MGPARRNIADHEVARRPITGHGLARDLPLFFQSLAAGPSPQHLLDLVDQLVASEADTRLSTIQSAVIGAAGDSPAKVSVA